VRPRVYYLNVPKKFIAGTIYDPVEEEVYIGADCVLTCLKADCDCQKTYNTETNAYGDFWFEGLPDSEFKLEVKADGKSKVFDSLNTTDADINLGDVPLT